jgi:hypothetical protein
LIPLWPRLKIANPWKTFAARSICSTRAVLKLLGSGPIRHAAAASETSGAHVAARRLAAMIAVRRQWAEREALLDVIEGYRRLMAYIEPRWRVAEEDGPEKTKRP